MRYSELILGASKRRQMGFQRDGTDASCAAYVALDTLKSLFRSKLGLEIGHSSMYDLYNSVVRQIAESGVRDPAEIARRALEGTWFGIQPTLKGVLAEYARVRGLRRGDEEIGDYVLNTLQTIAPGALPQAQQAMEKVLKSDLPENAKAAAAVAAVEAILSKHELADIWFSYEAVKELEGRWVPEQKSGAEWAQFLPRWLEDELERWSEGHK